jgi:ankyrin repeat protein
VNGRFNKFKQTPLMKICFAGDTDLLNYFLVKLKADTAIIDVKDETCLFSAVKGNHPEIVSQLL